MFPVVDQQVILTVLHVLVVYLQKFLACTIKNFTFCRW
jgi:hypothetical protein